MLYRLQIERSDDEMFLIEVGYPFVPRVGDELYLCVSGANIRLSVDRVVIEITDHACNDIVHIICKLATA